MMRKTAAFQLLLARSVIFRTQDGKGRSTISYWLYLIGIIGANLFFTPIFGSGGGLIIFPVVGLFYTGLVINRSSRMYELVPATRRFVVLNIFLFSALFSVFCFLLLCLIGYFLLGLVLLVFFLTGHGSFFLSLFTGGDTLHTGPGSYIFALLLLLILVFAVTALLFLKSRKLRIAGIAGVGVVLYIPLYKIIRLIHAMDESHNFFTGFSLMPYAHLILLCTGIACAALLPLSVFAGSHFYDRRFGNMSGGQN